MPPQQIKQTSLLSDVVAFAAVFALAIAGFACSAESAGPVTIDPPTAVTATLISPTSARISWTASAQAAKVTSYNVFRNGIKLTEVSGTSYIDNTLSELTVYAYGISANGPTGIVSAVTASSPSATVTAPDVTPPTITAFTPSAGATNIAGASVISATFSEAIDPSTLNATNFAVRALSGLIIGGAISYSASTHIAEFRPNVNFASSSGVSVLINSVKDIAGNPMASQYSSTFTVRDEVSPTVNGSIPSNGAANVEINSSIIIGFSEQMNASTINPATFIVTGPGGAVSGGVAYDAASVRATFTPTALLLNSTLYTIRATTGMTDVAGNALGSFSSSFTTIAAPVGPPPVITAFSPANGATGVPLNVVPAITFSTALNVSTISFSTITITPSDGSKVDASLNYNTSSHVVTIIPLSPLKPSFAYTITVTTGLQGSNNVPLASQFTSTFTTAGANDDTTPPTVISSLPANGVTNVGVSQPLAVTFSEPVDRATVTSTTMSLKITGTSTSVPGIVDYNSGTNTGTFYPNNPLLYSALYTLTISTGVKDVAGNALASPAFVLFSTEPPPDLTPPRLVDISPANGATNVQLNTIISLGFSRDMNSSTINSSTITLARRNGMAPIAASVTYDASRRTAVLIPTSPLDPETGYRVAVTTAVKGSNNVPVQEEFDLDFSTLSVRDNTPPFVLRTNPDFNETDAPPGVVTATFSEDMDPSTINSSTFTVSGSCGSVSYDQPSRTATYTPTIPFVRQGNYAGTVAASVKDLAGNSMTGDWFWQFSIEPSNDVFTVGGPNAYTGNTCDGAIDMHLVLKLNGNILTIDPNCTDCYLKPLNQTGADEVGPLTLGQNFARITGLAGTAITGNLVIFDFGLDNGRSFRLRGNATSNKSINGYFGGQNLRKFGVILIQP